MYKTYKFRMYPNDKQKELIHKNFGCVGINSDLKPAIY